MNIADNSLVAVSNGNTLVTVNDGNSLVTDNAYDLVKVQTYVFLRTKMNLKIEAIRRGITIGQLIDELAKLLPELSKKTS